MIQKLKKLKKELEGTTYPTTKQIERYCDLADEAGQPDYDIIHETYAINMIHGMDTLQAVSIFLEDVTTFQPDYYILDGYGNLGDVTSEKITDKIDDILTYKGEA